MGNYKTLILYIKEEKTYDNRLYRDLSSKS